MHPVDPAPGRFQIAWGRPMDKSITSYVCRLVRSTSIAQHARRKPECDLAGDRSFMVGAIEVKVSVIWSGASICRRLRMNPVAVGLASIADASSGGDSSAGGLNS